LLAPSGAHRTSQSAKRRFWGSKSIGKALRDMELPLPARAA
jgi:hypothetical protein